MKAVCIYSDGACSGNPGPGGWAFIYSLCESEKGPGRVVEKSGRELHTTNNRMEMLAVIQALDHHLATINGHTAQLVVHTDSQLLINGATQWRYNWKKRGWKKADGQTVVNEDLWVRLDRQLESLRGSSLEWRYVPGHSGVPANERVDFLAVQESLGQTGDLYEGSLEAYTISLDPGELKAVPAARKSKSKKSSGAFVEYWSLVAGKPASHSTWAECERRVKGVSGARYKKVTSSSERNELLRSWGCSPAPEDE